MCRCAIKYNASAGQRELLPHRDGSVFSFNIALNDDNEYKGGGTSFRQHVGNYSPFARLI